MRESKRERETETETETEIEIDIETEKKWKWRVQQRLMKYRGKSGRVWWNVAATYRFNDTAIGRPKGEVAEFECNDCRNSCTIEVLPNNLAFHV